VLKQPVEIQSAYSDTGTAEEYVDKRFTSAWGSVVHAAQVALVNGLIQAHQVKRVLELAPGPARLSKEIAGFDRGYLCEFNESMLTVARRRLRGTGRRWQLMRGDGFQLPLKPGLNLDMVYTFRFVRHFEMHDRAVIYQQVRSVLKDRGLFVFDAVNAKIGLPARRREAPTQYPIYDEFYTPASLRDELLEHGFTLLSLSDVMRHMTVQQQIQVLVGPRSFGLARRLISLLEYLPGQPLEWVAVCQKTPQ
jgi:ubiquinone/menaquinone biosynthesis C-methylase UbiE